MKVLQNFWYFITEDLNLLSPGALATLKEHSVKGTFLSALLGVAVKVLRRRDPTSRNQRLFRNRVPLTTA
ncbi:hypothetical protein LSAT2_000229 [Lamellibrachia satsuma]|nr:hypothetical protein LSAT2_000229 [Lamellibrachia satsuma]